MSNLTWTVGSARDCDICVDNPTVSSRHCRLTLRGESLVLEDLGSANGTYVAGERIDGPRLVRRGDPVTLGRETPLPWPPAVATVTVGRLPDNDVVIPLDVISGRHARLEREGTAVYLVDLASSNGTAINDPRQKITRARLEATDTVYLGSHQIPAVELLKMLPAPPRAETVLESSRPEGLERELANRANAGRGNLKNSKASPFRSPVSWLWGIGLSAACAATFFAFARRPPSQHAEGRESRSQDAPDDRAFRPAPEPVAPPLIRDSHIAPLDQATIRRHENGVVMIGLRIGQRVIVVTSQGWAFAADRVICATEVVEDLEKHRASSQSGDISLVVCTPTQAAAVIDHVHGTGETANFSVLQLETPLETVCPMTSDDFAPMPKQPLALLVATHEGQSRESITRRYVPVMVDHIERADTRPAVLHCTANESLVDVAAAAAFDALGNVVGCVRQSDPLIEVVPLVRLKPLIEAKFP